MIIIISCFSKINVITGTNYAGMLSLGVVYLRLRNAVKSRDNILQF